VKRVLTAVSASILGGTAGGVLVKRLWLAKYREQEERLQKSICESNLLYSWLLILQNGVNLLDYFTARGYENIAVFGMNRVGRLLISTLGDMAAYGVELDNPNAVHERLTVYRLGDDPLPEAGCMVICDLERSNEKKLAAEQEFPGKVITLPELLDDKSINKRIN